MSNLLAIRPYAEDMSQIRGDVNTSKLVRQLLMAAQPALPAAVKSAMESEPPTNPDQVAMTSVSVTPLCIAKLNEVALKTGMPKDLIVRLLIRHFVKNHVPGTGNPPTPRIPRTQSSTETVMQSTPINQKTYP